MTDIERLKQALDELVAASFAVHGKNVVILITYDIFNEDGDDITDTTIDDILGNDKDKGV